MTEKPKYKLVMQATDCEIGERILRVIPAYCNAGAGWQPIDPDQIVPHDKKDDRLKNAVGQPAQSSKPLSVEDMACDSAIGIDTTACTVVSQQSTQPTPATVVESESL